MTEKITTRKSGIC